MIFIFLILLFSSPLFACESPGQPFFDVNSNGCYEGEDVVYSYPQMWAERVDIGGEHIVTVNCGENRGYTVPVDAPESNPFFPSNTTFNIICPSGDVQTYSWSGFFKDHDEHTSLHIVGRNIIIGNNTHTIHGGGEEYIEMFAGQNITGGVVEIRLHDKNINQYILLDAGESISLAPNSLVSAVKGHITLSAPVLDVDGVIFRPNYNQ